MPGKQTTNSKYIEFFSSSSVTFLVGISTSTVQTQTPEKPWGDVSDMYLY